MTLLSAVYRPAINIVFALSRKKLLAKYTEGNDERQGILPADKLARLKGGAPIWVHAVSVGEAQAAVPFIKAARDDGYGGPVVLSTTTQTGKAMAARLGAGLYDAHIYYPWDTMRFVRRALDSLTPAAFITAETELWPNMLCECEKRGIPAFLINGRISDRTWARVQKPLLSGAARSAYSLFTEIFLRDEEDMTRLASVGVSRERLHVMGDCKADALIARKDEAARDAWLEKFASRERPIFIAGSTHTGEDEIVIAAFEMAREHLPNARLIIAPRHPERASSVAKLIDTKYRTSSFSQYQDEWDILIIDKIGLLFELYGTARAAFVGGSFTDKGGQNILEPFSWGVPVQYGPHMEDFAQASRAFLAMGAATQVSGEKELAAAWLEAASCADDGKWRRQSRDYFAKSCGASARTWNAIKKYINGGEGRG
ncbi:MAG: glycosyltransferase N-terminal domain-containing protein [Cloacibacillus sp.]